jgi:hypothetical protein
MAYHWHRSVGDPAGQHAFVPDTHHAQMAIIEINQEQKT